MSFQEVGGPVIFMKIQHIIDPFFEGVYVGAFQGKYGTQHKFKAVSGRRKVYVKGPAEGSDPVYKCDEDIVPGYDVVINGTGTFDYKLDQVTVGDLCRVVYLGLITLASGKFAGKPCHDVKVLISDEKPKLSVNNNPKTLSNDVDLPQSNNGMEEMINPSLDAQVESIEKIAPQEGNFKEADSKPIHSDSEIEKMMAALRD